MNTNESLVEFQTIVNVYVPTQGGRNIRQVIRSSERDTAISKYEYLKTLIADKKKLGELKAWTEENLNIPGFIVNIEGLYGVSYIKIL